MARWRALELFCGLGGFAAARPELTQVVAAVDVSQLALEVYRHNFDHLCLCRSVESISVDELTQLDADLWWMSPPCQPYTRRGLGRGLDDPRGRGFLTVLDRLAALRPAAIALENVPEFAESEAHRRLRAVLEGADYEVHEQLLCPSELGWPNRRRRFYLVASRDGLQPPAESAPNVVPGPLATLLEPDPEPDLWVDPQLAERYEGAFSVVEADDPRALTACFTSAYGRSHVRSGSYLRQGGKLRRFSPTEVLRLLGFPPAYRLPRPLPRAKAWRLAGNSLSLPAVRRVLDRLPAAPGQDNAATITRPRSTVGGLHET